MVDELEMFQYNTSWRSFAYTMLQDNHFIVYHIPTVVDNYMKDDNMHITTDFYNKGSQLNITVKCNCNINFPVIILISYTSVRVFIECR